MKFILDAQLPKSLSDFLRLKGFDSIHTLELPDKNKTQDNPINTIAETENRIIITKDNDFLESFLLEGKPSKLVLVKKGNISNAELIRLFDLQLGKISSSLKRVLLLQFTKMKLLHIVKYP